MTQNLINWFWSKSPRNIFRDTGEINPSELNFTGSIADWYGGLERILLIDAERALSPTNKSPIGYNYIQCSPEFYFDVVRYFSSFRLESFDASKNRHIGFLAGPFGNIYVYISKDINYNEIILTKNNGSTFEELIKIKVVNY